jgi:hypothetical protein
MNLVGPNWAPEAVARLLEIAQACDLDARALATIATRAAQRASSRTRTVGDFGVMLAHVEILGERIHANDLARLGARV